MSLAHYRDIAKRDLVRWGTCFVAVLGLHGAVAAALLSAPQPEGDTLDAVTAIDVDFTTESFKDAQARDIAPGEEQQQTDAAPPPMEKAELKAEAKTEPVDEPQPVPDEPTPVPPLPTVAEPDVTLQTAAPPKQKKKEEKKDDAEKTPNAAPPVVAASATTAPTMSAARTAQLVSWKRKLALHLQRNKRYPPEAQARREAGTTKIAFVVDRSGHVVSSSIVQGSGSAALDRETLDLLQRAQPLPTPPAEVGGNRFAFAVPILFQLK
uniref:TonB family protein n=1 Tax=Rhodopseudomonas palustris (strain BisA53) TaxID=316055 RepID=Q07HT3_RHOP5